MIIKLFNSETGDEQLLNISKHNIGDTFLIDIKNIVYTYEKEHGYGCTIDGLLNYLRYKGYTVGKIDYVPKIEFNH